MRSDALMSQRGQLLLRTGWFILIAMALPGAIQAQSFRSPRSALYQGLGAYSRNFNDVLSAADNPTALVAKPGPEAAIFAEKRFMLNELNQFSIASRLSGKNAGIGLQLQYGGYEDYNETLAGLGYARDLGKIRIGAQFNYHHLNARGYGSAGTWSADLAFTWDLTEQVRAGIQVVNLVPVFFGPDKTEQFSSVYKLGIGYDLSDKCFLVGEVFKENSKPVNVQAALQYQFLRKFFMRLGLNTDVGRPFCGFGWAWNSFRLDMAASYHPHLGFSPGVMLIFSGNVKN